MKIMFFCDDNLKFREVYKFLTKAKPGSTLFWGWETIMKATGPECRILMDYLVKTKDGYLARSCEGYEYTWRFFTEAPTVPVETEIITSEAAFKILAETLPINSSYDLWYNVYECDEIWLPLCRLLTRKEGTWDFHNDPIADNGSDTFWNIGDPYIRVWTEKSDDYVDLTDTDSIGWYNGQLYALDFEEGLYALGTYDESTSS